MCFSAVNIVKMRLPRWTVPVLLRFLSLAGLTFAGGDQFGTDRAMLRVGFALSSPTAGPTAQPRPQNVSLDLDFFVQVANHELTVPIMPLYVFYTFYISSSVVQGDKALTCETGIYWARNHGMSTIKIISRKSSAMKLLRRHERRPRRSVCKSWMLNGVCKF
jgi:hypothetical protein